MTLGEFMARPARFEREGRAVERTPEGSLRFVEGGRVLDITNPMYVPWTDLTGWPLEKVIGTVEAFRLLDRRRGQYLDPQDYVAVEMRHTPLAWVAHLEGTLGFELEPEEIRQIGRGFVQRYGPGRNMSDMTVRVVPLCPDLGGRWRLRDWIPPAETLVGLDRNRLVQFVAKALRPPMGFAEEFETLTPTPLVLFGYQVDLGEALLGVRPSLDGAKEMGLPRTAGGDWLRVCLPDDDVRSQDARLTPTSPAELVKRLSISINGLRGETLSLTLTKPDTGKDTDWAFVRTTKWADLSDQVSVLSQSHGLAVIAMGLQLQNAMGGLWSKSQAHCVARALAQECGIVVDPGPCNQEFVDIAGDPGIVAYHWHHDHKTFAFPKDPAAAKRFPELVFALGRLPKKQDIARELRQMKALGALGSPSGTARESNAGRLGP